MAMLALLDLPVLQWIRVPLPQDPPSLATYYLLGGFIAPLAEELFFRGVVYGFFRRWGPIPALAVSTLAFVAAHGTGPVLPIAQLIGGILFGLAYEREAHLLVPITIHATGNMALFTISLCM